MKRKPKVVDWLIDKKDKLLDFCRNNPEFIELVGAVGSVVGGGLYLGSALVKANNDKANRKHEKDIYELGI